MKKIIIGVALLFATAACAANGAAQTVTATSSASQGATSGPATAVAPPAAETAKDMEQRLFPGLPYDFWQGSVCYLKNHPDKPTLAEVITYHWNGGSLEYPKTTFQQFDTLWRVTFNDCAGFVDPTT